MTRLIRPPEPEPLVEYSSSLALTVTVISTGELRFDGVGFPEPARLSHQRFVLRRRQRLPDLSSWPLARRQVDVEANQLVREIGALLVARDLDVQTAPPAGALNSKEVSP